MAPPARPDVFLLHHAEDRMVARELSQRLTKHGVNAGSTLIGTGAQVLLKSRACVLLVGRSARQKGWAWRELAELAKRRQAKEPFSLVTVYLAGVERSGVVLPPADHELDLEPGHEDDVVAMIARALGGVSPEDGVSVSSEHEAAQDGEAGDDGKPAQQPSTVAPADTVDTLADHPAEVDELGRKVFAEVLVKRIRHMRKEDARRAQQARDPELRCGGPFLLHLYAPWGAGKTSVLNFMRAELEDDDAWTVIDFNAWAHQRTAPPWWWLMTAVFRQGSNQLRRRDKRRWLRLWRWEVIWRLRGGTRAFVVLLVALALAVLAWRTGGFGLTSLENAAKAVTAVLVLLTTVGGILAGASRWLLVGSPRAAGAVLDHTRDPLQTLKKRFRKLIGFFDNRVAIFIDDLDRCKAPYVVELLEGIQTLFNDVPVTYVVAADREWLCESYALEYEGFVTATSEPGRPLGYLFLEKTFQLSAPVPTLSFDLQKEFLDGLLRLEGSLDRKALDEARGEAERKYELLPNEEAIAGALKENRDASPVQRQAEREAAVLRLAAPEVEARTGHTLQAFAPLLERNPRAMKRLINAYGVARATEILSGAEDDDGTAAHERLALWTILGLRWPLLAEHLSADPVAADEILAGEDPSDEVPVNLRPLWRDERVRAVLDGDVEEISAKLDQSSVDLCAGRARGESPRANGKPAARPRTRRRTPARAAK
jgi:hypothetical protein